MTEQEMLELDEWIAEHVMGYKRGLTDEEPLHKGDTKFKVTKAGCLVLDTNYRCWMVFNPTVHPAATMQVLEKCVIKRTESWNTYRPDVTFAIHAPHKEWDNLWIIAADAEHSMFETAETLPLAICKFAKALFSKSDASP